MAVSFVTIDRLNAILYYRKSNGTWAQFTPSPGATGANSNINLTLPNGNIILQLDSANNYTIYNTSTNSWTTYAKPAPTMVPATGWVINNNLVLISSATGLIDQWDGTSFSRFTPALGTTINRMAAISATDIIAINGNTNIWHLEAGVWVNIGGAANAALGVVLQNVRSVITIGTAYYFIANTVAFYLVFKYDAGVWTQIGANVPAATNFIDNIWGINEANLWIVGRDAATSNDKIVRYNSGGGTWDTVEFNGTLGGTMAVQDPGTFKIWGSPNAQIVCVAFGENAVANYICETTNNGTNWNIVFGPFTSAEHPLKGVMYREVPYTITTCPQPNINGDFSLNHYKCLRNQFENPDRWSNPTVVPFSKAHSGLNIRKNNNNSAYNTTPGINKDKS